MAAIEYPFHAIASTFPLLEGDQLDALVGDIRANGLREAIWLFEGKILDGRNRKTACLMAGVAPTFREFSGTDEEAIKFSWSMNGPRRHLTESQLSMAGAKMRPALEDAAKKRQQARKGNQAGASVATFPHLKANGKTRDQAGAIVGVSGKSIDHASRVLKSGTKEVVKAVEDGKLPVSVAAKLSTLPAAKQDKALAGGKPAIKAAVKEAAEAKRPDWAKGPTPQEEAANDPARCWNASLHKVYVMLNSTREAGGIKKLARKWSDDAKADYCRELLEIIDELHAWINILEEGK